MAELKFYRGTEELMRLALPINSSFTIGRDSNNDIQIPDPAVSKQQCEIKRTKEGLYLKSFQDKLTLVNKAPIEDFLLNNDDEISLGAWRAVYSAYSAGFAISTDTTTSPHGMVKSEIIRLDKNRFHLWIKEFDGTSRVVSIADKVKIGRNDICDVVLEDKMVSSEHATLEKCDNRESYVVKDLGSTNGTLIGNTKVPESEIRPGDAFTVGETQLVLRQHNGDPSFNDYHGMAGQCKLMQTLFRNIDIYARSDGPVLISGESGVGKELVARAIHAQSGRKGAFITINCANLSNELFESEIFGHKKGAFTGATEDRKGAFEHAHRGTLFLDELGALPSHLQAKFLRVVEDGKCKMVGSEQVKKFSVRVISATNEDVSGTSETKPFRRDLLWRLSCFPIDVPSLLMRGEREIQYLIHHFIKEHSSYGLVPSISPEAINKLVLHSWPGNVRELNNVIMRAMLLRDNGQIEADHIVFRENKKPAEEIQEETTLLDFNGKTREEIVTEVTARLYKRIKSINSVADELGESRNTIKSRLRDIGLIARGDEEK